MRWPWRVRGDEALRKAHIAEANLIRAQEEHTRARALADEALREAERSKRAHHENGFAELIRVAMGVHR